MRLICPKCEAQYEVGDDMIPVEGRDVQCSNCAHTWFEEKGASEQRGADRLAAPTRVVPSRPIPGAQDNPAASGDIDAALDAALSDVSVTASPSADTLAARLEQARATNSPETTTADETNETKARSTVTPNIADILKQEAALETERRNAPEPGTLESQPDLNLQAPVESDESIAEDARRRMARLKEGVKTRPLRLSDDDPAAVAAAARGDMLPDVEEINSSLRNQEIEADAKAASHTGSKSLFGRGFLTAIAVAILLLIVYLLAPAISNAIPAVAPVLSSYVDTVDAVRLWLDLRLQGFLN